MDYTEYIATVTVMVMGKEFTFTIPYLDEPYDEESIYDMAEELIVETIEYKSFSIRPMECEMSYE